MNVVRQSNGLWMLVLLLACLTVVCETSAVAAPSITLLGGEHHIHGGVNGTSYDDVSPSGSSGQLLDLYNTARVDFDQGHFAQAESWASVFSLRIGLDKWVDYETNAAVEACAEATWLFQPKESALKLCLGVHAYEDLCRVTLADETGALVAPEDCSGGLPLEETRTMTFGLDPLQKYSLYAYLFIDSPGSDFDDSYWATFDARVCTIPAPSALLLGVFGTALVGRWRRAKMV